MKSMVLNEVDYPLEMQMHHKRRYDFAGSFLNFYDRVLDVGCGSGYGCNILSKISKKVYGIDKNPNSIREAKENFPQCNFMEMDVTKAVSLRLYDVITCFELLEHLDKEDGSKLIGKLADACKNILIFSVPVNSKIGCNPYHKSQWSEDQLEAILNLGFSRVIFMSQDWASSLIHYPYSEQHSFIIGVCIK